MIGFRNGREANASLALQPFFLLGNQDVRVFRLKDWLIFLGAVSYVVCERICSSIVKESVGKSLAGHLFKDGRPEFRPGSMVMSGCLSLFWTLIRLGFDPFGPSTWKCWVKTHGTHNAPLFSSGEFVLPWLGKYCVFYYYYLFI